MSGNQQIQISKDANGNVFISGDGNIVIVQATRTIEPQQPAVSPAIGPNPYKGLSAFLEEDAERFFGREKLIRDLWKKFRSLHEFQPGSAGVSPAQGVREEDSLPLVGGVRGGGSSLRLLAILGPSGSGKSSVVRAGLIPELARRPLPGMRQARVAVVIPGNDPIGALAITLARIATNDPSPAAKSREFAAEISRRSVEGECDGLQWIARNLPDIAISPLIVLIDQFEEVYTLPKEEDINKQKEAIKKREQFINNLLCAAADPSKYVSVIITLRSDFLGQTQRHPDFNHAIAANGVIVPVMNDEELHETIAKPAKWAGHPLDEATIRLLIEQTEGREGTLPLLQFALTRIWENLPVDPAETLKKIKGVGGALAGEAQRLFDERLSQTDRGIARRAFLAMVRLGEGTQDTRRRISLSEIVAHGEDPHHVHEVLQVFSQPGARLITLSADADGSETAEVTHEALFDHWEMLKDWLDSSRDDLRFHRRLAEAAKHWDEQEQPEGLLWRPPDLELLRNYHKRVGQDMTEIQIKFFQESVALQESEKAKAEQQRRKEMRTTKRLRRLVVGLTIIFLVAVAAALYAWRNQQIAEQKSKEAERQARIAKARQLSALAQSELEKSPGHSLLFATEALNITLKEGEPGVLEAQQALRDALLREPLANTSGIVLYGHEWAVTSVAISSDSHWLVTTSDDHTVRLWDLTAEDPATAPIVLRDHMATHGVTVSPDNHWVIPNGNGIVRLWDLTAEDPTVVPIELRGSVVAVSPDSHWLVTGSGDGIVRLWDLTAEDPTITTIELHGHVERIWSVAISPDNHWIVSGSDDATARLWDLTAKDPAAAPIVLCDHQGGIWSVAFSPDNHWVVTGSEDGTARLWDLTVEDPAVAPIVLRGHQGGIWSVAFSPDNHWLVTGSGDGTARLWDLTAEDPATAPIVLRDHQGGIWSVAFSPDNHWLVTGSGDGPARLWDLTAEDPAVAPIVLRGHERKILSVAFSPDNHWVVTGSMDGTARLWDLNADLTATPIILGGHEGEIWNVAFSPDNQWIVSGSEDTTARLWNLTAKDPAAAPIVLRGHKGEIWNVAFSPDNHWVVTGSEDTTARLWNLTAEDPAAAPIVLRGHETEIGDVAFSPDSHWLVTGNWAEPGGNTTVRLWSLTAEDPTATYFVLHGHTEGITSVTFSPDSHWFVTGSEDGTARLWDLTAEDPSVAPVVLWVESGSSLGIRSVVVNPNNHWLVTSDWDTVWLWDLRADSPATTARALLHDCESMAVSPDNRWLVTGSEDNTVQLWDLKSDDPAVAPIILLRGDYYEVESVTVSPDNHWLVTSGRFTATVLWDLSADNPSTTARLLSGYKTVISPDSRWLVTGSEDNTVRLWNLTADDAAFGPIVLRGHESCIWDMVVSPDSRWLGTSSRDGTVRLWRLQLDELINLACQKAGRNFSYDEWRYFSHNEAYHPTCPELPVHPDVIAVLVHQGKELARQGRIEEAIANFEKPFLELDPTSKWATKGLIVWGESLAREGNIEEALAAYEEAQSLDPTLQISADSWYVLCNYGSLYKHAAEVLDACEQAVALKPENGGIRDSRGLARALTGDIEGAIEDFQAFVEWTDDRDAKSQRQSWIEALQAGENPFTPEVLEKLREE